MPSNDAINARDDGIARAAEHADRVCPEWKEQAYQALVAYAVAHPTFTIEQLRQSLNGQLADPPSLRAWGGIAQRARRANIIEHFGWDEAEDPAVHCNVIRVWKSLTFPRSVLREVTLDQSLARGSEVYMLREQVRMLVDAAKFARHTAAGPMGYTAGADRRLAAAIEACGGAE